MLSSERGKRDICVDRFHRVTVYADANMLQRSASIANISYESTEHYGLILAIFRTISARLDTLRRGSQYVCHYTCVIQTGNRHDTPLLSRIGRLPDRSNGSRIWYHVLEACRQNLDQASKPMELEVLSSGSL